MDEENNPNIVLIVMDTARASNLSCYGHENKTTPFLDSIAEDGIKYNRAISQGNRTQISHASMFTGDYVSEHRIDLEHSFPELDVFQDKLSEKGYKNIGAANVAFLSDEFGTDEMFDEFFYNEGLSFFSDLPISRQEFRDKEGYKRYLDLTKTILREKKFRKVYDAVKRKLRKYLFIRDTGARKTNNWVKNTLNDESEPFFLFINYLEPHGPYQPPFPYSHKFLENKFKWFSLKDTLPAGQKVYPEQGKRPSEEQAELWKSLYDAEINYLDSKIEELYEWLKQKYPNTVFIFTSDHGQYFLERDIKGHGIGLHDEVTRVPLIEEFPNGHTDEVEGPVELRNLHDHILELADGDLSPINGGEGYSEDINEEDSDRSSERLKKLNSYSISTQDSNNKLIWYSTGEKELYSLPEEKLIEEKKIEAKLSNRIIDEIGNPEENELIFQAAEDQEIRDEKLKEKLKDLGYLG